MCNLSRFQLFKYCIKFNQEFLGFYGRVWKNIVVFYIKYWLDSLMCLFFGIYLYVINLVKFVLYFNSL